MIVEYILYALLACIGLLFVFMIIRTACVRPTKTEYEKTPITTDSNEVAKTLSEAIKIPTVTKYKNGDDQTSFLRFHEFLKISFPEIFKKADVTVINNYSLIIRIDGSDKTLMPGCFLAHQDVVPATNLGWDLDPFGGEIKDGFVHGRGSLDMKNQLICSLYGLELLLRDGKEPVRTIYYCFGHDEENTGVQGALNIVEYLKSQNIRFEFVLDEGGIILDGKMLQIDGKVALIGTCEKGYADFLLTVQKEGGHASSPKKKSSVDILADAIHDLRRSPRKLKWTKPTKELFRELSPFMKPLFKFMFVNRDILGGLLKHVLCLVSPYINSILRTTFAFTQLQGADAPNVIPFQSSAVVNTRINIGETVEEVQQYIQDVVGKDVKVSVLGTAFNPTPISKTKESEIYNTLTSTISEKFGFVVAPYPFIAATDAKHYYPISDNVYRFTPFELSPETQKGIHGLNECCSIESLGLATDFFKEFIIRSCY